MNESLISVIVPVFNVVAYLEKCVNSILNQSYSKFELILVDDGSTDGSSILCDTFANNDSRIRVIHKKNGGVSAARNEGIKLAKGLYFAFIDSDDYVEKEYLETLYFHLINSGSNFAVLSYKKNGVYAESQSDFRQNSDVLKSLFEIKNLNSIASPWGCLFKSSSEKLYFNESIYVGEDTLFVITFLLKTSNQNVLFVDKPLYHYSVREGSATNSSIFDEKWFSLLKAVDEIYSLMERYEKAEHILNCVVFRFYFILFLKMVDSGVEKKYNEKVKFLKNEINRLQKMGCGVNGWKMKILKFCYLNSLSKLFKFFVKMKRAL